MASTKDHMLAQPFFLLVLRFVQAVVAVVILGLAAYGVTEFSFDGDSLMLFTALATMIIAVYIIVAEMAAPIIYNYWAILGLDIFATIFWIISMSLLADEISEYSWVGTGSGNNSYCFYDFDDQYVCYRKRSVLGRRATTVKTYRNALAAACGLAGLELILFVITLVFLGLNLHRHRKAGGHCSPWLKNEDAAPAAPAEPAVAAAPDTTVPAVSNEAAPVTTEPKEVA